MEIAFIGYGELGRQVHALIQQSQPVEEIIFFDDELKRNNSKAAFPFEAYSEEQYKNYSFIVALGYKQLPVKQRVIQKLTEAGRKIYSFIHPSGFVNPTATIDSGAVVYPLCNIDKEVRIGKGALLNNSVTVSHNAVIGNCCYLSPGVVLSGNVTVGENTFIGAGAVIANNISIGKNVIIGIGTVVTENIPDYKSVIGNPMKFVNTLHLV